MAGQPLLAARIELSWGVRLAEAGRVEEAQRHLQEAATTFERLGAAGWLALVQREFTLLPSAEEFGEAALAAMAAESTPLPDPMAAPSPGTRVDYAPWEITLLGSFSVRRYGEPVSLPLSLAAQGLKIVALHEKIPVEELVELLWPDAAPGVGTRRLRNVLWRVRAASGELLERDDNFIRLAQDAMTDVGRFRQLGEEAIRRDTPPETAGRLAREALLLYRGELLPGDRYADWAAGYRESFARLHIQLLDLLLDEAVSHEHLQEALALLDRLIDADPYEENHYLRAAELLAARATGAGRSPRWTGPSGCSAISGCRRRAASPGPGPRSTRSRVRSRTDSASGQPVVAVASDARAGERPAL